MTNQHQTNQDELLLHAQRVIRDLRNKLAAKAQPSQEPVAVVGMACRFPCGPGDLDAFWEATLAGANAVRELPHDRWNSSSYPGSGSGEATLRACFLEQPYAFDTDFFGISSREAMQMDPAQRLFLEVTWHALEDAGQTKRGLAGSETAVFAGNTGVNEFLAQQLSASREIDIYTGTGTGTDVIAGRLAYLFDLQGPCATINTACSSSLVALHLARRSLLAGECNMAIAGGVNILGPVSTAMASRMDFLAPDGCSKPFDEGADGFGRGEGCGVVILKRLSDAVASQDRIHAVIHGSAMNQDGRTNGLTAPNGRSQVSLLRRALKDAGIAASQIGYVEAHGTGTPLGDPIEVEAISEVLGNDSSACGLGSAKGNIGHLEGAAGIAGVIRAVLILQHQVIPPVANFHSLNPHIALEGGRLFVPSTLTPWPRGTQPRYAGVSSFGWSGTNAHVILGEAPTPAKRTLQSFVAREVIVPVSAADPISLQTLRKAMARAVGQQTEADLTAFAWSAGARRSHHAYRFAVVGNTCESIAAKLLERTASTMQEPPASAPAITIFFGPEQNDSAPIISTIITGMLDQEPVFKDAIERCVREIKNAGGYDFSISRHHLTADASWAEAGERTALFLLQFGLTELLKSWGVHARNALGEGVGSVMAALTNGTIGINQAVMTASNAQTGKQVPVHALHTEENASGSGVWLVVGLGPSGLALKEGRKIIYAMSPSLPARRSILDAVAALYEAGTEINWDAVSGLDRHFVPLPSYPFLHKDASDCASIEVAAPDDWFYETTWPEMPIPIRTRRHAEAQATRWIIVADGTGFGERLAQAISRSGDDASLIRLEESLTRREEDAVGEVRSPVDRALEGVGQDQPVIVVHSLALDLIGINQSYESKAQDGVGQTSASHIHPVIDTLMGLVHLFRVLRNRAASRNIKLWVVTRNAQRLTSEVAASSVAQSSVWGFSASAALDEPDLWGGIVDLDPHPSADEVALFTQHVLAQDGESRALFREGQRHVARLRQAMPPMHTQVKIDPDATYLITGAFGGIGLSLAEWLVASGAKHLVLLGRGLAPIHEGAQSSIERWRASGVEVQRTACDVADLEQVSTLFSQCNSGGHPIQGILHAAAEVIWKPLIDLKHADLRGSFHAKAEGSIVLHELSRTLSLDFLAFFSSASVTVGARGGCAYAAANAFMDALALQRGGMGLPALSIQWGNWQRKQAHAQVDQQQLVRSGFRPMQPELATEALGRMLARKHYPASADLIMVAEIDLSLLKAATAARGQRLFLSELEPELSPAQQPLEPPVIANLRRLSRARRLDALTDLVSARVRHTLGWTARAFVDPVSGFFDMGFDSLTSVEFEHGLAKETGLSLPATFTVTHSNVRAVTLYLDARLFGEEPRETIVQAANATTLASEALTDAQAHEALAAELQLLQGRFDD